jgi:hypothetical protein
MRRLAFALVYCVFLAASVAAVDYLFFWRPFYERLRVAQRSTVPAPPPHVDELTMRRVGSLRADRGTSFARFELTKRAGAVRVCAFGDSFTYGDEVADGHDFPATCSTATASG